MCEKQRICFRRASHTTDDIMCSMRGLLFRRGGLQPLPPVTQFKGPKGREMGLGKNDKWDSA